MGTPFSASHTITLFPAAEASTYGREVITVKGALVSAYIQFVVPKRHLGSSKHSRLFDHDQ